MADEQTQPPTSPPPPPPSAAAVVVGWENSPHLAESAPNGALRLEVISPAVVQVMFLQSGISLFASLEAFCAAADVLRRFLPQPQEKESSDAPAPD